MKHNSDSLVRAANAAKKQLPDGYKLILFTIPPESSKHLRYISNLRHRHEAIEFLKDWLKKASEEEQP